MKMWEPLVARVIRPGHPAKRDKEVSDTNRSRYARCPGLMTRATRGSSCIYFKKSWWQVGPDCQGADRISLPDLFRARRSQGRYRIQKLKSAISSRDRMYQGHGPR